MGRHGHIDPFWISWRPARPKPLPPRPAGVCRSSGAHHGEGSRILTPVSAPSVGRISSPRPAPPCDHGSQRCKSNPLASDDLAVPRDVGCLPDGPLICRWPLHLSSGQTPGPGEVSVLWSGGGLLLLRLFHALRQPASRRLRHDDSRFAISLGALARAAGARQGGLSCSCGGPGSPC